jgi:hypothetical protein
VATQGRSFWILDDLSPLRQHQPELEFEPIALLQPGPTYRQGWDSVRVHYYLKEKPATELTIEMLDPAGKVIKTFSAKPEAKAGEAADKKAPDDAGRENEGDEDEEQSPAGRRSRGDPKPTLNAGMNLLSWNMRYPDAAEVPGAVMWGGSTRGPASPPGRYSVRLTVGETTLTAPFEIRPHPKTSTTDQQYQEQFETLMAIRDALDETHTAINRIRTVRAQVQAMIDHAKKAEGEAATAIADGGKALLEKLAPVEEQLIQTRSKSSQDPLNFPIMLNNKIAALSGAIDDEFPVTPQVRAALEELRSESTGPLAALTTILETDVPAFNELVRRKQVPAVIINK